VDLQATGLHDEEIRIVRELFAVLRAAAPVEGLAVRYRSRNGVEWQLLPAFMRVENIPAGEGARTDEFRLKAPGHGLNPAILVVTRPASEGLARLVWQLVEAALDRANLQERENQLLEEMGANWETLEALYELNTTLRVTDHPWKLLNELLRRRVLVKEGLSAAIYVEGEGRLVLAASNGAAPKALAIQGGLAGRAIRERRTQVINGREGLQAIPDLEPEWRNASNAAVAPIATRQGLAGAVIMWRSNHPGTFDTPLLRLVEALANQAAMVIEGDRLNRALREGERLRQEIEIASSIQQTLLLDAPPEDLPGLEIASFTLASQKIDGDFCEFIRHQNGTVDVLVGDVMGKGVPAALVGAATKHHLVRAMAELATPGGESEGFATPGEVVALAAQRLGGQLIALERFVTLCYARLDATLCCLEYVDCGHPSTILYQEQRGECSFLNSNNLPLGVDPEEVYEQQSVVLSPGDLLLFYSDGVTEARNPQGELFGAARLAECVKRYASLPCQTLLERIRADVVEFSGAIEFADDFTSVAVRVRRHSNEVPLYSRRESFPSDLTQLAALRQWASDLAAQVPGGLEEGLRTGLELAVDEALANVIQHAYDGRADGRLEVQGEAFSDRVTVRIFDWGRAFDPAKVAGPAFDGSRESGFGLYIIAHSVDEVSYSHEPEGRNCVCLTQFRKPRPLSTRGRTDAPERG
jgi:sigma-B regulation protein RsbU (phosphoserine phosphatase)